MKDNNNIIYPDIISGPEVSRRDKLLSVWNRIPFWIPVVTAIVIICTAFVVRNVKQISGISNDSMFTRALLPEEEHILEGIYCVRSLDSGGVCSTAEIVSTDGGYEVTIFSDYEPLTLEASKVSATNQHHSAPTALSAARNWASAPSPTSHPLVLSEYYSPPITQTYANF